MYDHYSSSKITGYILGVAGFAMSVVVLTILHIALINCYRKTYENYERAVISKANVNNIFKAYKETENKAYAKEVEYGVMREQFIHSTYFVKYNEHLLHSSFYFPYYLVLCLDRTYSLIIQIKLHSLIILLLLCTIWKLIEFGKETTQVLASIVLYLILLSNIGGGALPTIKLLFKKRICKTQSKSKDYYYREYIVQRTKCNDSQRY